REAGRSGEAQIGVSSLRTGILIDLISWESKAADAPPGKGAPAGPPTGSLVVSRSRSAFLRFGGRCPGALRGRPPPSEPDEPWQQARLPRVKRVERCELTVPRDVPADHTQHALDQAAHQVDRYRVDLRGLAPDTRGTLLGRKETDDYLARR